MIWRVGSYSAELVRPGEHGCASLAVLRRRSYLRVFTLPRGRALVLGRLPL